MERRNSVNALMTLACNAGRGISFDPERYGNSLLDSLEQELQAFLAKLPEEVRSEYEQRYIDKYAAWMSALSRCMSVMITGAGNFNKRRHEKTNKAEEAARQRLTEWADKVIKRCNHKERLKGWDEVERLQNKHEKLVECKERIKATNKILRSAKMSEEEKRDELAAIGWQEKHMAELFEPGRGGELGFPAYMLSNYNAEIRRLEEQINTKTRFLSKVDTTSEYMWGSVDMCYSEERIRIFFDDKPEQDTITMLKQHGMKWSPNNGCWQRQITPNAVYSLEHHILPALGK